MSETPKPLRSLVKSRESTSPMPRIIVSKGATAAASPARWHKIAWVSAGPSEQPSLTFSELLNRWRKFSMVRKYTENWQSCEAYQDAINDLAPLLARLEALAAEWEARAGQLPGMGYASDHNRGEGRGLEDCAEELRAILGNLK